VDAANTRRLLDGARALDVSLDDHQLEKLDRYLELLLTWNRKINLTAITEPAEIVERHFLDSLAVAPLLCSARTLVDIGSGAGFPGAVLAVARPELQVTAVEPTHKKVAFLQTLAQSIAPNLTARAARHDALIAEPRRFDAVVSRATWDPSEWVTQGSALVAPGGLLIAMLTTEQSPCVAPPGFMLETDRSIPIGSLGRRLQTFRRST
jgi:16S rRNA (guanine527-N7)-methyltransferase